MGCVLETRAQGGFDSHTVHHIYMMNKGDHMFKKLWNFLFSSNAKITADDLVKAQESNRLAREELRKSYAKMEQTTPPPKKRTVRPMDNTRRADSSSDDDLIGNALLAHALLTMNDTSSYSPVSSAPEAPSSWSGGGGDSGGAGASGSWDSGSSSSSYDSGSSYSSSDSGSSSSFD